ncbi:hypothetical protein ACWDKQ_35505, partial [Saccharopolyspora sp. NPDC000995]
MFSKLGALEQESLRWRAEMVLARDHDFRALDGRTADELLALRNDMAAVLARPLAQDDQRLADELSRNLAHEFQTARSASVRPGVKPDTVRTIRTPDNRPGKSVRQGPSHATGKPALEPIQEEQPNPDGASPTDSASPTDGDPARNAPTSDNPQALKNPEAEPQAPVVLPTDGPALRRQGWGAGLPTEVTGPKRQSAKRPREETGESSGPSKRHKRNATAAKDALAAERKRDAERYQARKDDAARVAELEGKERLTEAEAEELQTLAPKVAAWEEKQKKGNARQNQARKDDAARVAELAGKERLTEAEAKEWQTLEPKVAKRKQMLKNAYAKSTQARKNDAARLAELEKLEEQGQLNPEQRTELDLRREIEKGAKEENRLKFHVSTLRNGVAELKKLQALPQRSDANEAKLSALQGRVAGLAGYEEKLGETRESLKRNKAALKSMEARGKAGSGRITGVEAGGQQDDQDAMEPSGVLEQGGAERDAWSDGDVNEEDAEIEALEALPRSAEVEDQLRDKVTESASSAKQSKGTRERLEKNRAELKSMHGAGAAPAEQAAEDSRATGLKQRQKEMDAERYQARKDEAARLAELEGKGQEQLTGDELEELETLKLKVTEWKRQKAEIAVNYRKRKNADAARLAELEGKGQEQLTGEEAEQLETLKSKVAEWKRQKAESGVNYRKRKNADAARLAELEGREELTGDELEELETLRLKVAEGKRRAQKNNQSHRKKIKSDADQVAELKLKGPEELTREDEEKLTKHELKEVKHREQRKKDNANRRVGKDAAADRVAELKKLEEQGQLTGEQKAELDLRQEIEKDTKEENRLNVRVSRRKKWSAEIKALEALPQSAANKAKLSALRDKVDESAGSVEELKEARERLKRNKAALKSMEARGKAGSGRIAGVEAGEQQEEQQEEQQDAMESSGESEQGGADRGVQIERDAWSDGSVDLGALLDRELADSDVSWDVNAAEQGAAELDTWSDAGVDLGVWVDEVMAGSGGEGQAAASLSGLDEDWQTGLEASWESDAVMQAELVDELGEGLGAVVQEQVEGVAGDEGRV